MIMGSLWADTAAPPVGAPSMSGRDDADIVIIGAGYTGLSTALHLAEMGREVIIIEAGEPGDGASGRNGGQVIPGIRHFPDELIKAYGNDLGHRIHTFGASDADYTFDLIKRLGLSCDAHRGGWIQAAETDAEMVQGEARVKAWAARGAPVRVLAQEEFCRLTGTEAYIGGWIDERGGSVQPLSYVRELARATVAAGARLYKNTPATALTPAPGGWSVQTAAGDVRAKRVLLATSAMTGALAPAVHRSQLGVWSFQIATRPLTVDQQRRVLPGGAVVSDTRRVLRYFRRDRDGRVIVGGKGTLGAPTGPDSFSLQVKMLERLYPDLALDGFNHAWGGMIGITLDRLPRLFTLGDGAFAVLQDNGKGVAWCTAMGAPLAQMLAGKDVRDLPLVPTTPPRPIPLHALRKAYVAVGNIWLRLLDASGRMKR